MLLTAPLSVSARVRPSPVLSGISFVVSFESSCSETRTSLYHDTVCYLYRVRVCVGVQCFREQGGEGVTSGSFMRFPLNCFPLCRLRERACEKVCGRFHGTVPYSPLHLPPSLPSSLSPSFLLNLSFCPVQTVCRCCPPSPSPSRLL